MEGLSGRFVRVITRVFSDARIPLRRLMDEFEVVAKRGSGVKVTTKKWVP